MLKRTPGCVNASFPVIGSVRPLLNASAALPFQCGQHE
jgi:hypothetical protein